MNCSNTFFSCLTRPRWCRIRALESAQPAPIARPFLGCSMPSTSLSSLWHLQDPSHEGWLRSCSALARRCGEDRQKPARLPPRQQPTASRNGSRGCKVVLSSAGLENSLGRARGFEWGWPGQHLEAAAGGFGADKLFRRMTCQGSAKYMKTEIFLIFFRSLYLGQIWEIFYFFFFRGAVKGTSLTSEWPPCQFSWRCSKPHRQ